LNFKKIEFRKERREQKENQRETKEKERKTFLETKEMN